MTNRFKLFDCNYFLLRYCISSSCAILMSSLEWRHCFQNIWSINGAILILKYTNAKYMHKSLSLSQGAVTLASRRVGSLSVVISQRVLLSLHMNLSGCVPPCNSDLQTQIFKWVIFIFFVCFLIWHTKCHQHTCKPLLLLQWSKILHTTDPHLPQHIAVYCMRGGRICIIV